MSRMFVGRKVRLLIVKILFRPAEDILEMAQLNLSMVRPHKTPVRTGHMHTCTYRGRPGTVADLAAQEGADRVQTARQRNC
ncbi:hypothetical protein [Thermogemmatispora aurantia]|uniref:hypothetical protein n=1 Tax=Thermogemmatispora aurantia TaxID=2045279 RepID=UPI001478433B|nr:hypothetical protein [Thermogemmatispora aurantia]